MITLNHKVIVNNGKWIGSSSPSLHPYTIRLKFTEGVTPTFSKGIGIQVSSSPNIWDLTYENTDWTSLLEGQLELLEVINGNTSNVTNMLGMFYGCTSLTTVSLFNTSNVTSMDDMFANCTSLISVPLFDTSNVIGIGGMFYGCSHLTTVPLFNTSNVISMDGMFVSCTSLTNVPLFDTSNVSNMQQMFSNCTSLTTVPLFNTSRVTYMQYMFYNCINVQSGALALYQQASTQANPPSVYYAAFVNCGSNTQTGTAELEQIPSSWGGRGA